MGHFSFSPGTPGDPPAAGRPDLPFLPAALRRLLERLPDADWRQVEELRIRLDRPLEWIGGGRSRFVTPQGGWTDEPLAAYRPDRETCGALLDLLTQHSLYSFEEELRRGFVTAAGGHRVGLAGKAVLENGRVKRLRDISGFNIRLAREVQGAAAGILPALFCPASGELAHTLIVSPPQQGKTTLARDLARLLSSGGWRAGAAKAEGRKVGIVDERSELAACIGGVPRFDVGPRTDVLDGCPKAEGMMMLIRSMSPEVIVVDEIGREEDAAAIREAVHAGIRVIATAHGTGPEDVSRRPVLCELMASRVFTRIVVPRRRRDAAGAGGVECRIYDEAGRRVMPPNSFGPAPLEDRLPSRTFPSGAKGG